MLKLSTNATHPHEITNEKSANSCDAREFITSAKCQLKEKRTLSLSLFLAFFSIRFYLKNQYCFIVQVSFGCCCKVNRRFCRSLSRMHTSSSRISLNNKYLHFVSLFPCRSKISRLLTSATIKFRVQLLHDIEYVLQFFDVRQCNAVICYCSWII